MTFSHSRTVSRNVTCNDEFAFGVHPLGCLARPNTLKGGHQTGQWRLVAALLAVGTMVAGLMAVPARASNLLANPSFETNSGNSVPTGWTFFEPPTSSRHD